MKARDSPAPYAEAGHSPVTIAATPAPVPWSPTRFRIRSSPSSLGPIRARAFASSWIRCSPSTRLLTHRTRIPRGAMETSP